MSKRKSGGTYCVYSDCKNRFYSTGKHIKYFRFPKDENRCRLWLEACGRPDLLMKDQAEIYSRYRICSAHFEDHMFMNIFEKSSLLGSACPIRYQQQQQVDVSVSSGEPITSSFTILKDLGPPAKKIKVTQHLVLNLKPTTSRAVTPPPVKSPVETQTPQAISAKTPRKENLRKAIEELRSENVKLKKDIEDMQKKSMAVDISEFKRLCEEFLTPAVATFVKCQLDLSAKTPKGKRYNNEFKQFCLSLYFLGPRCYRQFMTLFVLPSPRSIYRYIEKVKCTAGYSDNIFELLQFKVDAMSTQDRICTICIDEMSIKSNLFYDYGADEIIGLEDDGFIKTDVAARSAAVIMLRGIKSNWKQTVGYIFSGSSYNANNLKELLDKFIFKLCNIGFNIVCIITDMGSNFIELSKILGVSDTNSIVTLGGKELFYYFDPSHLIKATRNNLLTNQIQWDDQVTSWKYIENFYLSVKNLKNKMAPKLTNSHIYPSNFEKMRVKYAVQVLSHTVASGMETFISLNALPQSAQATVDFISHFNKLFDVFNSCSLTTGNIYNKPFSGEQSQVDFLVETINFLNKLTVYNQQGKSLQNYMKFIICWKISINSLMQLWDLLKKEGFKFILTRRLNQDCLENFFGKIRQQIGNANNPTPIQFVRSFRKLFVLNYITSKNMNCQEDFSVILASLTDYCHKTVQITNKPSPATVDKPLRIQHCDYQLINLPSQNAFKYVCGYLINKCLKIHTCNVCVKFSIENDTLDASNLYIHYKNYQSEKYLFGSLKTPHESFYNYIYCLEQIFFDNFANYTKNLPGKHLLQDFKQVECLNHPCPNFPHEYLLKLFVRLRIYYVLKNSNSSFRENPKKNRKLCILLNL